MNPIKYVKEVAKEGKRIRWPKREILLPTIVVVICISVFVALFLTLEDLTAGSLINQLRNVFGGK
ncbi:MAG: preprotein translocase subunit SecE [Candidatus Enteromonas sp.]|nr:preprotein translocase subunit SecE [Candidatus Enteromonas sp.]MDY6093962.1 preprotein translocase subunit SecE [Candidatus Enteromonas sp.]